jgi:hypothetical protein
MIDERTAIGIICNSCDDWVQCQKEDLRSGCNSLKVLKEESNPFTKKEIKIIRGDVECRCSDLLSVEDYQKRAKIIEKLKEIENGNKRWKEKEKIYSDHG